MLTYAAHPFFPTLLACGLWCILPPFSNTLCCSRVYVHAVNMSITLYWTRSGAPMGSMNSSPSLSFMNRYIIPQLLYCCIMCTAKDNHSFHVQPYPPHFFNRWCKCFLHCPWLEYDNMFCLIWVGLRKVALCTIDHAWTFPSSGGGA